MNNLGSKLEGALSMRLEQFFQDHNLGMVLMRPIARLVRPFAWVGHLHFAQVLINLMRPRVVVELGTHTGNSFCAFCQAVEMDGLDARCYAVDTWIGDAHAGYYNDNVYANLSLYIENVYGKFARMLRMTFEEALSQFEDGSIDLLHIDGLHSYEAVRHDFEAWAPKLSPRGVVLFHDTRVLDRGFGVHRLWAALRAKHSGFEFLHSHGLGILLLGSNIAPAVREFVDLATEEPKSVQTLFERVAMTGLPGAAIDYLRRFGSGPDEEAVSLDCELFLDRGVGFSEGEKLIHTLDLKEGRGVVRYDLCRFSDGLLRVRFDPGNEAVAFEKITARYQDIEGAWHQLDISSSSSLSMGQDFLLFAGDPWVEFAVQSSGINLLEIEVRVKAIGLSIINLLVGRVKSLLDLSIEVEARRKAEAQLWNDLSTKDRDLAALRTEVEERRTSEAQLWNDLSTKDCDLAVLRTEVEVRRAAEAQLWSDLSTKDRDLVALRTEVEERRTAEAHLWNDLSTKDRDLVALRTEVEERRTAEAQLWSDLSTKDCDLAALLAEVEVRRAAEDQLWNDLSTKDRDLAALRTEVEVCRAAEAQLWSDLSTKDRDLAALHAEVEVRRAVEAQLWNDLSTKDRDLAMLRQIAVSPICRMLAFFRILPRFSPSKLKGK